MDPKQTLLRGLWPDEVDAAQCTAKVPQSGQIYSLQHTTVNIAFETRISLKYKLNTSLYK